jgi:hypothetical protein
MSQIAVDSNSNLNCNKKILKQGDCVEKSIDSEGCYLRLSGQHSQE